MDRTLHFLEFDCETFAGTEYSLAETQHFQPIIQDCIVERVKLKRRRCFMFSWRAHRVTAISCRRRPATTWTFPNWAKNSDLWVTAKLPLSAACLLIDWLIVVAPFVLDQFLDSDTETRNVSTQESVCLQVFKWKQATDSSSSPEDEFVFLVFFLVMSRVMSQTLEKWDHTSSGCVQKMF